MEVIDNTRNRYAVCNQRVLMEKHDQITSKTLPQTYNELDIDFWQSKKGNIAFYLWNAHVQKEKKTMSTDIIFCCVIPYTACVI